MTRSEFCAQIQQLKSESHLKDIDICMLTQFFPNQVKRITGGSVSFGMNKCFILIEALKGCLQISNDSQQVYCKTYRELLDFLIELRVSSKMTPYKLSKVCDIVSCSVLQYEKGNTSVSVDTFLKIMDAMGYTVEMKRIE